MTEAFERPFVSVLLPARNAASTLPAALRSVQRQTEPRWECIVVDDGSADGTAAVVAAFAATDRRFRLLERPFEGIVGALNAGLERCRGEAIARMDADDLMHRERLSLQLRALREAPGLVAAGAHVRLFPRSRLRTGMRSYESWLNGVRAEADVRREAFVECPVAHPTLFLRRDVLERYRFRDLGWPEDYDLVLRLLHDGLRVGVVPQRLLSWRHGPERLSRVSSRYGMDRFTACKAAFLAAGPLRSTDRYVLWGFGETGKALRRALTKHGKHPATIVELHPRRIGRTIHGAPVVPPERLHDIRERPILVSVARAGPRDEIRGVLGGMGLREERDYVCTA